MRVLLGQLEDLLIEIVKLLRVHELVQAVGGILLTKSRNLFVLEWTHVILRSTLALTHLNQRILFASLVCVAPFLRPEHSEILPLLRVRNPAKSIQMAPRYLVLRLRLLNIITCQFDVVATKSTFRLHHGAIAAVNLEITINILIISIFPVNAVWTGHDPFNIQVLWKFVLS